MAELADAADSKSADLRVLWVRVPPPVPNQIETYLLETYLLETYLLEIHFIEFNSELQANSP